MGKKTISLKDDRMVTEWSFNFNYMVAFGLVICSSNMCFKPSLKLKTPHTGLFLPSSVLCFIKEYLFIVIEGSSALMFGFKKKHR